MCGIIGIIDPKLDIVERLINVLSVLEYRGYDSAGIATINNSKFQLCKSVGKISVLNSLYKQEPISGNIGIGHTRWATHGKPSLNNTHPIVVNKVAVVHNGIIENNREIRDKLNGLGYNFSSETDTEVIPALISYYLNQGVNEIESVYSAIKELKGAFSCVIMFSNKHDQLIAIKNGSPLILGLGNGCNYVASDILALSQYTDKVITLSDKNIAVITHDEYSITDFDGNKIITQPKYVEKSGFLNRSKGSFNNFMLKEIYEQPTVLKALISNYCNPSLSKISENSVINTEEINNIACSNYNFSNINWEQFDSLYIIACGSSFYAAYIAKYWIEELTNKQVNIEIASEFRLSYKKLHKKSLYLFISQSGETADTLACLKYVKSHPGLITAGLVNINNSQISLMVDHLLLTHAGIEIAVASTKTFTAQLLSLALLCIEIMKQEGNESWVDKLNSLINDINKLEPTIAYVSEQIQNSFIDFSKARNLIYIGHNISYPLALEGALKMKELAYIPSDGIASGELKHGSIALVDEQTNVIVIAPKSKSYDKLVSNIQEINARDGKIILISSKDGIKKVKDICSHSIEIPTITGLSIPLFYSIPLQMLAYYTAIHKGYDPDRPRNLAKSVTVE